MSDLPGSVIFHDHGPREGFQIETGISPWPAGSP